MDAQKLPPELSGLTEQQLKAAAEFARNNPHAGSEILAPREAPASKPVYPEVSAISDNSSKISEEQPVATPVSVEADTVPVAKPVSENLDIAGILANDGKVKNPQELLEQVLNLAKKNENDDTAYKV